VNTLIRTASLMAIGCSLVAFTAQAASLPDDYVFVDAFAVSNEERIPDEEVGFGGRIGIGGILSKGANSRTGIELGLFKNPIESSNSSGDSQTGVMIDLVQQYTLGGFNPYVFAGLGGVSEGVGSENGIYGALEAGGGLLFGLTDRLTARVGLSAMSVHNDEFDSGQNAYVDVRFNAGLLWPFGASEAAPAPAPAPRAVDSDGDGLADAQDRCPSTPASTADGCPPPAPVVQTDSDNDGVYDSQDECQGTLEGLKVDARGCAVQTETQSVVLKGVTFLPSSANLTPEAKTVLDAAVAALSGQKDLKVELGGHTDSQGKDAANLALSQKRAESVRQYLVDKGIEAGRLTAKGYGETQPIADNNTREGRTENRRVELKIVK